MSGALALLRDRPPFRALWAALGLSYAGSGAALTALTLYVQQSQGTGIAVAGLLIAETAPRLLGPLAGSVVDRLDLRRTMIASDLGQATLFLALAVLPPYPMILALTAMAGMLQTAYGPARTAALPFLVDEEDLLRANSLTGTAFNLYVAVGPLVGGLLFAAGGASLALIVNAITFLASAQLTRRVPPLPAQPPEQGAAPEGFLAGARTGIRYALDTPLIRTVILAMLLMFSFVSIDNVALVFLVRDTLGGGAAAYGIVSAFFGFGMLAGSFTVMRGDWRSPALLYLIALGLSDAGALLTAAAPAVAFLAPTQLIAGSGNGIEIVAGDTIFQRHVTPRLRGRVYGLTSTAVAVGTGVAMVLGGFLVDAASPRVAFVVAGAGGVLATAVAAPALLRGARPAAGPPGGR